MTEYGFPHQNGRRSRQHDTPHIHQRFSELERENAILKQQIAQFTEELETADYTIQQLQKDYQQLHQEQRLLRALIENSSDFIGMVTLEGQPLYLNQYGRVLVGMDGVDSDTFQHTSMLEYVYQDEREDFQQNILPVLFEQERWEGEMRFQHFQSGEAIPVYYSAFLVRDIETSEPLALGCVTRDLTTRKQQEELLGLAQFTIEHASDGIHWLDSEGRQVYANEALSARLGYSHAEMMTMGVPDIDPNFPHAAWPDIWQEVKQAGSRTFETTHRRKDGSLMPVEVLANYINFNGKEYVCSFIRDITERKQHEARLRTFETMAEQAPDGIAVANEDGIFSYANPAYHRIMGYTQPMVGQPLTSVVTEEVMHEVIERGVSHNEVQYCRQDGSVFPAYLTMYALADENGKAMSTAVILHDISQRKQAERDLRLAQHSLEQAVDGIFWSDMSGQVFYVNEAACRSLGYSRETMQGMNILDFDPKITHDALMQLFDQMREVKTVNLETTHQRKDGSLIPVEINAGYFEFEGQEMICSFVRDITERKQNEEQMQTLAAIVDNSPDFIGIATLEGKALYVNQAGRNLVGLKDMEAVRQTNVIDFFLPEDHPFIFQEIHPTVMEQGRWEGVFRFRHYETGALIPINYNLFLVKDQQTGEPIGLATVTRDMTEQQRAEAERAALQEQVIDAQRAALRELSTPLIPITDSAVVMPLIGSIDTLRAQQIMEALLDGISAHRATVAIIDITGVQIIDTQVANALIQAAQAAKLLGARVMLTGIQPQIAQTLVHLGVNLGGIDTRGSLQAGIAAVLKTRH